jgi:hypothetical protein
MGLLKALQAKGIKKIADVKIPQTTQNLERVVGEGRKLENPDLYLKWLNDSNPKQLYVKILTNTLSNKKLFLELTRKLLLACDSINRLIHIDTSIQTILNMGGSYEEHEGFIKEMHNETSDRILVVEQLFSDIKNELEIS